MFEAIDAAHANVGAAHLELLRLVVAVDRSQAWRDQGARDVSHWLWMRYGISNWKAQRWVVAAHALERLPRLSEALAGGELGIDKVVELARFATPETEADLIAWAKNVSCGAIRRRGDLEIRATRDEVIEAEQARSVSWWYFDDGASGSKRSCPQRRVPSSRRLWTGWPRPSRPCPARTIRAPRPLVGRMR